LKEKQEKETLAKKPDEAPFLHIEAKVRIFDPETNKTVFEGRA